MPHSHGKSSIGTRSSSAIPVSERQQMALVMQMTSDSQGGDGDRGSIDQRNECGETPLHLAAIKGDLATVTNLLDRGADPNVQDFAGWRPLHEACNHGWLSVAKILLERGATVNPRGHNDDTPLHDAAVNNHLALVKLLIEHGANPTLKNKRGKTPGDVAASPEINRVLARAESQQPQSSGAEEESQAPPQTQQEDARPPEASTAQSTDQPGNQTPKSEMRRLPTQGKEKVNSSSGTSSSPRVTLRIHQVKEKKEKVKATVTTTNTTDNQDSYENNGSTVEGKNGASEDLKENVEEESKENGGKERSGDEKSESAEGDRTAEKRAGDAEEEETRRKRRKEEPEVPVESPKVPPLKIVLGGETETTRKSGSGRLPYVVAAEETPPETETPAPAPPSDHPPQDHESHKRVLRSHRSGNGSSGQSGNSSPAGEGPSPRVSPVPEGEGVSGSEDAPPATPPAPPADLHPRKRKLKVRQPPPEPEPSVEPPAPTPAPHTEPPTANCYQLYLNIRKQIDRRRKGLFPVQPKPPQGFKDYLMNRCTYVLAGNKHNVRIPPPVTTPPTGVLPEMKDMFLSQEKERYRLRTQHVIEKEKLVLSVEQEILRVHGRAARALANQALPFSACTILKDEEVYSPFTAEQEEKERNARSRYNGRLFLSWLQDVDDKWEKIKEAMLLRHHNEAESLHAVQKMDWEWKLREVSSDSATIDESHVPMVHVSDDFDLLPA